jgi:phosphopentomutase
MRRLLKRAIVAGRCATGSAWGRRPTRGVRRPGQRHPRTVLASRRCRSRTSRRRPRQPHAPPSTAPALRRPGGPGARWRSRARQGHRHRHWEMTGLSRALPSARLPEVSRRKRAPRSRSASAEGPRQQVRLGTEILKELGEEHLRTGSPSLTPRATACSRSPPTRIYPPTSCTDLPHRYEIACLQYGVCRVIARPFVGTTARHLQAHAEPARLPGAAGAGPLLDGLAAPAGPSSAWGKIEDIFTGRRNLGGGATR